MALLITKHIEGILGTLTVESLYIRLQTTIRYSGDNLAIYLKTYLDKQSYESNEDGTLIPVSGIPSTTKIYYTRTPDTTDILIGAHEGVIQYLTTDESEECLQYDPSTGELLTTDEGEPIMGLEITRHAFCNPDQISIIDVSIY